MTLPYHPEIGTLVICDFHGFVAPEMVKRRPAVIMSHRLKHRDKLCTIVPLSTTPPDPVCPYHFKLHVSPPLPHPYASDFHWVKADMIYTVSFDRLNLPSAKDANGKRAFIQRVVDKPDLLKIKGCMLHALGMTALTDYLC